MMFHPGDGATAITQNRRKAPDRIYRPMFLLKLL
jgi:hypothetical protein